MQAAFNGRTPLISMLLLALAIFGALMLGAAGGYLLRSSQAGSSVASASNASSRTLAIDRVTGYPAGSLDDQRILAILKDSRYVGGATVVQVIDPITGHPYGSADDRRILVILDQAGYEGGGTIAKRASAATS